MWPSRDLGESQQILFKDGSTDPGVTQTVVTLGRDANRNGLVRAEGGETFARGSSSAQNSLPPTHPHTKPQLQPSRKSTPPPSDQDVLEGHHGARDTLFST